MTAAHSDPLADLERMIADAIAAFAGTSSSADLEQIKAR